MKNEDVVKIAVRELKRRGATIIPEVLMVEHVEEGTIAEITGEREHEHWLIVFALSNVPEGCDESSFAAYVYPDGSVEVPSLL